MAPKRRNKQVVGSMVKAKVVQETVEVTTAIVADDSTEPDQAPVEALPSVDVSCSTVVHVEVATPDADTTADVNVKQQPPKRGRGRRREEDRHQETAPPPPPGETVPVPLQSQETQDPNEEQEVEDASKKKKQKQRQAETEEEEKQPETPRVASERKPREAAKRKQKKQEDEKGGVVGKKKKQLRRRRRRLGGGDGGMGRYKLYVWRVLKQVHPDMGVSGKAMQVLDMMMADMFERLAEEAARLTKVTGRATLTSREVQSAVRLVLPGELEKHVISEGVKAISKYMAA